MNQAMVTSSARDGWIRDRALLLTNEPLPSHLAVWTDTSNFMAIERGHVVELEGRLYLIRSNEHEGRFGIDDQPKFWVKHAIDLETGAGKILKLVFQEAFRIRVGALEFPCRRSAEKEARVLRLVRGDDRFMQGGVAQDARGNLVRVIDTIPGVDLLTYLQSVPLSHEAYCRTLLPGILRKVADCFAGIQRLHDAGLCHGDIRNDHLLIDRSTGAFRWIDFDLDQEAPDFDVWSAGNVLHYVAGKGFVVFREVVEARPDLSGRLTRDDASAFFPYRVMNLRKVYPYLPENLNRVLCRFAIGTTERYRRIADIAEDLAAC